MTIDTPTGARRFLQDWLSSVLAPEAVGWLLGAGDRALERGADGAFFMAFGLAPRKVGKGDLALTTEQQAAAREIRQGWDVANWSADQAARALLVLSLSSAERSTFLEALQSLFNDGDLGEQVALYRMLPLLPFPDAHVGRASEGVRSNMKPVFEAVALRNPYPSEHLGEDAWNQMVLKCLFVDSRLYPVVGLDERANPKLARMLVDYAHERWAAGRTVSPELWRCVGPVAQGAMLDDLKRAMREGGHASELAVALAVQGNPAAATLMTEHPELNDRVRAGQVTWRDIAEGER